MDISQRAGHKKPSTTMIYTHRYKGKDQMIADELNRLLKGVREMSAKNCDKYNRWRSITIGFRVSPEEAYALDMRVLTSGLTKQDYCTKKVLDEEVIVRPNIRVQKYVCQYLNKLTEELKRLEKIEQTNDVLDNLEFCLN